MLTAEETCPFCRTFLEGGKNKRGAGRQLYGYKQGDLFASFAMLPVLDVKLANSRLRRLLRRKFCVLRRQFDTKALAQCLDIAIVVFIRLVACVKSHHPFGRDALYRVSIH